MFHLCSRIFPRHKKEKVLGKKKICGYTWNIRGLGLKLPTVISLLVKEFEKRYFLIIWLIKKQEGFQYMKEDAK